MASAGPSPSSSPTPDWSLLPLPLHIRNWCAGCCFLGCVCVCVCVSVLGPGKFHLPEAVSLVFGKGEYSKDLEKWVQVWALHDQLRDPGLFSPCLGCRLLVLEMRV